MKMVARFVLRGLRIFAAYFLPDSNFVFSLPFGLI
jgi:hypothetical protein